MRPTPEFGFTDLHFAISGSYKALKPYLCLHAFTLYGSTHTQSALTAGERLEFMAGFIMLNSRPVGNFRVSGLEHHDNVVINLQLTYFMVSDSWRCAYAIAFDPFLTPTIKVVVFF